MVILFETPRNQRSGSASRMLFLLFVRFVLCSLFWLLVVFRRKMESEETAMGVPSLHPVAALLSRYQSIAHGWMLLWRSAERGWWLSRGRPCEWDSIRFGDSELCLRGCPRLFPGVYARIKFLGRENTTLEHCAWDKFLARVAEFTRRLVCLVMQ